MDSLRSFQFLRDKAIFRFHFVVLFISVPTENIRFWLFFVVIKLSYFSLPHDTCAGRQIIKSHTLERQLCVRKTAKIAISLSIVLLEH